MCLFHLSNCQNVSRKSGNLYIFVYAFYARIENKKQYIQTNRPHLKDKKKSFAIYHFIYFTSIKHRQSANRVHFHSRRTHRTHQVATIVKLMMWHTALNYGETIYYIHIRVLCIWPNNESLIMCYMCSVVVCVQLKSQTNTSRALAVYHSFFI